jgi:hypothetical protein
MQEDWNSIGGQHFKFISLDVSEKWESEKKKNEKMLNLNLFIQMILLFTTYREPRLVRAPR